MKNFNELTEEEVSKINGGRNLIKFGLEFGEQIYEFGKGIGRGFVKTARSFKD
ncbi:MAG: hypothetical protein RSD77_09080 [Romboutsia sp.]